ncbi:MAG: SIR2 family protein [Nitrospira sp.]
MAHEREELHQVAQFLATKHNPRFPLVELEKTIRSRLQSRGDAAGSALGNARKAAPLHGLIQTISAEQRQNHPNDPHLLLARLPLPVFITTNADSLLEEALRAAGKAPESMLCPWNAHIEQAETVFDRDPDYEPSPERPLVFHLFGRWDEPLSLVLTEDDYFKFLIGVTQKRKLLPPRVREMLSDAGLLFLGFQTEEWNFRVLYHSILAQGSDRHDLYTNIAAQIEPEDDRLLEPAGAKRYLEQYFGKADISIYWGSPGEFLTELLHYWRRWQHDHTTQPLCWPTRLRHGRTALWACTRTASTQIASGGRTHCATALTFRRGQDFADSGRADPQPAQELQYFANYSRQSGTTR